MFWNDETGIGVKRDGCGGNLSDPQVGLKCERSLWDQTLTVLLSPHNIGSSTVGFGCMYEARDNDHNNASHGFEYVGWMDIANFNYITYKCCIARFCI